MVDKNCFFMDWFCYNLIVLIKYCKIPYKDLGKALKWTRPGFYALVFYIFINNSRPKQNKKNPRHRLVDVGK